MTLDMSTAKTIHEAVRLVLQKAGGPCTLDEIVAAIREADLYAFKVQDPRGVVRQAIRRRCEGYENRDRAGKPIFKAVGPRQYVLAE